jgi:hypothetical protein
MMDTKNLLISLLGGIGITLITGLVPRTTLLGATHYGWPMAWRIRLVLAPQYNPWRMLPIYIVLDTVLWGLIIFLIIYYAKRR